MMTLIPTNVLLKGKRVWLQDATSAERDYLEYHTGIGTPLKLEFKAGLPAKETIHHEPKRKSESESPAIDTEAQGPTAEG